MDVNGIVPDVREDNKPSWSDAYLTSGIVLILLLTYYFVSVLFFGKASEPTWTVAFILAIALMCLFYGIHLRNPSLFSNFKNLITKTRTT